VKNAAQDRPVLRTPRHLLVPGVNNLGTYGRWAFAEFTDVFQMQTDFAMKVESGFNKMVEAATTAQV